MATAAEPILITVAQYRELPSREDVSEELHWGQVVTLTFPKKLHTRLQIRLVQLLQARAGDTGLVAAEFPFRALPEYDLRSADVAFVSQKRWDATADDDNLHGAPDLVIEVLSPSNTKAELREKAVLCLANQAQEFWIVDPKLQTVTVMRPQHGTVVYRTTDRIPLALFGGELAVSSIFD